MNHSVKLISSFVDLDAFNHTGIAGNPAGVVLDASGLTEQQMQAIATKAGHPETAFVSPSDIATVKLDFFTPNRRIAHCGHATVAALSILAQQGVVGDGEHSKETVDGLRRLRVQGEKAYLEQIREAVTPVAADYLPRVADALGLTTDNLTRVGMPAVVNIGVSFMVVALPAVADLRQLNPNLGLIESISEALGLIGFYVISPETEVAGRNLSARMFAPYYGIDEEAATGMGAGCAAVYRFECLGLTETHLLIEQGRLMANPSPSLIEAELEVSGDQVERIWVGGIGKVMELEVSPTDQAMQAEAMDAAES